MGEVWTRRTTFIDIGSVPDTDVAAIERQAIERGIDWSPRSGRLAWTTVSTTEVGRLRRRTRTIRSERQARRWATQRAPTSTKPSRSYQRRGQSSA